MVKMGKRGDTLVGILRCLIARQPSQMMSFSISYFPVLLVHVGELCSLRNRLLSLLQTDLPSKHWNPRSNLMQTLLQNFACV